MKRLLFFLFCICFSALSAQNTNGPSGKYYSTVREFNEDGVLISEINYVDGKPIGEYKYFYEDGTIMEQGVWHIRHQVGALKRYDKNGNILQDFKFDESGKRRGNQLYYYPTGTIRATKLIYDNRMGTKIIRYSLDGKQKSFITL